MMLRDYERPTPGFGRPRDRFTRLLALGNVAIAQPLYDTLQRSPEFFIAHQADGLALAALVACTSLALAPLLFALEALAGLLGSAFRTNLHLLLCGVLVMLGAVPALKRAGLDDSILLAVAASAAAVFAFVLRRSAALRSVVSLAAVTALLIPGLFLYQLRAAGVPPSSTLDSGSLETLGVSHSTPVVLVVFDQLPTGALLDASGAIDARRHPNFAKLAGEALWFRNSTAVAQSTVRSLPAILTGQLSVSQRSPVFARYPNNVFSLLRASHSLNASELMTKLAPPAGDRATELRARSVAPMLRDVGILALHVFLPSGLLGGVPSIDERVANFGTLSPGSSPAKSIPRYDERVARVTDFLNAIETLAQPGAPGRGTFHFLHSGLPHSPYIADPFGRPYTNSLDMPGRERGYSRWVEDPEVARFSRLRFLLQLQFTDGLLGRILDAMERAGIYDDALFIVTSDHGVSFRPGQPGRVANDDTYLDILYVPLFIKLPGQRAGRIDDRNAQAIDIVPTIADVLDVNVPWPLEGRSLVESPPRAPTVKRALIGKGSSIALKEFAAVGGGEFERLDHFMSGLRFDGESRWIYPERDWDSLLGSDIEDLPVSPEFYIQMYDGAQGEHFEFERDRGWVQGLIFAPGHPSTTQWYVAVGIDGKVAGIARSFSARSTPHYFTVLLPAELAGVDRASIDARVVGVVEPQSGP